MKGIREGVEKCLRNGGRSVEERVLEEGKEVRTKKKARAGR